MHTDKAHDALKNAIKEQMTTGAKQRSPVRQIASAMSNGNARQARAIKPFVAEKSASPVRKIVPV